VGEKHQGWLPAPTPEAAQAARAYLTPRFGAEMDVILWESRQRLLPDRAAIEAVITTSKRSQQGEGTQPSPMEIAATLVVLAALRLDLDRTESALIHAAQTSGVSWEQIAAILDLSAEELKERHRQLTAHLVAPTTVSSRPGSASATSESAGRRRAAERVP
jgi:hypothetical protein